MNKADRLLLRNGFNLDGSPIKKSFATNERKKKKLKLNRDKKNLRMQILLANKNEINWLKCEKWALENR